MILKGTINQTIRTRCVAIKVITVECNVNHALKGALSVQRQFLTNECPFKMMKNAFYFILKALLFSGYLNFCLDFLVM